MKKMYSLAFAFVLLFSLPSITSAHGMDNAKMNSNQSRMSDSMHNNNNNNNINNYQNHQTNDGASSDFGANNATHNQTDRYRANSSNYRATAVNNDRGTDWGWLGLLGLTGLLGLRSRERERS